DPLMGDHLPLATLYGTVAFAVWFGGYRPALLAAALGYLACDYLFIEPRGSVLFLDAPNLIGLILYLFSCSIITGLGEAMPAARRVALDRQERLEQNAAAAKLAEEGLRRSEEQVRSIVDNVVDGIIAIDENGTIESINPAAEKLFGYPA